MKTTKRKKYKNKNLRNLNSQINSVIRFGHSSYSTASNYFYCLGDFESKSRFLFRHTKVLHEGRCHGSIDLEEEEERSSQVKLITNTTRKQNIETNSIYPYSFFLFCRDEKILLLTSCSGIC